MQNEELRRAQAELNTAQTRYFDLYDLAPVGYCTLSENGLILEANLTAATLLGVPRGALVQHAFSRFIPKGDQDSYFLRQKQLFKTGKPQAFELRLVKKGGTPFWAQIETTSAQAANGAPVCRLVLSDITDRKLAEEALRNLNEVLEQRVTERTAQLHDQARLLQESEERLRATLESIGDGFLACDADWRFVYVNDPAERLLGIRREAVLGQSLWAVFPLTLGTWLEREYRQAAAGEPRSFENFHQPSGRWFHNRCFPRAGGGLAVYFHDATERRRLEREILDISEREQQRTGHELHDGLGQQLHGLSYLAVLLEKGLREEGSPRVAEVGQLNKYLTEALEMTRNLAHGLQPVNSLPEGLMTALRELAERTRDLYRLDCRLACPAPVLIHSHSAANHLYRIAQEAMHNATKHAKPTRIRVTLAATGQKIILSVGDNGVGFPPRTNPGRGMGLRVMQYRANAIGGALLIRQAPRGGTQVVCTVTRDALLPQVDHPK